MTGNINSEIRRYACLCATIYVCQFFEPSLEYRDNNYVCRQNFSERKMQKMQSHRIKRELAKLMSNPPEGISCYPKDDKANLLSACIVGPHKSPYEGGFFELELEVHSSYPFEPPRLKFITPVYHPNIDTSGRICMDLLKMPPKGGWKPTITLESLLVATQLLLGNPNPDDPLMPDIATEYRFNKEEFERKAQDHTRAHAKKV